MYYNYSGLFFKELGTLEHFDYPSVNFTKDGCTLEIPENPENVLLSIGFDSCSQNFFFYRIKNDNIHLLKLVNIIDIEVLWKKIDCIEEESEYKQYSYLLNPDIVFLENPYSDESGDTNSDLEFVIY